MSASSPRPTPRREFLGQLATSAVALAGAACTTPLAGGSAASAAASPTASPADAPSGTVTTPHEQWDDSWFARLTAKHKAVFETAAVEEGVALGHAIRYISGLHDALAAADGDIQVVIVMRHAAIPMAFNDAMWAKYELGKEAKIKDGKDWATRNPYLSTRRAGGNADRPSASLAWFASHGHILLGCNLATLGHAAALAEARGLASRAVYDELRTNLVPGLILQPNGVYAVLRAQEAGCAFFKSS